MSNWEDIVKWFKENERDVYATLRRGVVELPNLSFEYDEIRIPSSLLAMYRDNDGQAEGCAGGIFLDFSILPVELSLLRFLENIDSHIESAPPEGVERNPSGCIKNVYISNRWLEFGSNLAGRSLAIDFDPAPDGRIGQIISYGMDFMPRFVLAESFDQFLELIFRVMSEGIFTCKRINKNLFTWADSKGDELEIPSQSLYELNR